MLTFRKLLNIVSCLLLLLLLVSASDYTGISTNYESLKTELAISKPSYENASVAQYKPSIKSYQSQKLNLYTVFNFKCLLNIHYFNFSITQKSQNEARLQFSKHPVLKQNLIAQINISKYQNNFI